MEELNEKVNVAEPMTTEEKNLPTEVGMWTKFKGFLLKDIVVELTPYQEKVFKEVHDFWHQEITFKGLFSK